MEDIMDVFNGEIVSRSAGIIVESGRKGLPRVEVTR